MEKASMHSLDMVNENIKKIGTLFPECVTETVGEDGKVKAAIDFEKLQENLSHAIIGEGDERYQFTWPGKRDAIHNANAPTNMTLRPCKEESVDFDSTQNLYIEGDNLEVLKLLQENYLGKIKMIYIDPPYNTGSDFVYNDDFKEDKESFESRSGMYDEEGNMLLQNFEKNTESNGRYHTDWLNMMYPRLKIARNLLSDDGVIFISIDYHEDENLKKICDELFGRVNYVGSLVVRTATDNNPTQINTEHEYMLCYSKNKNSLPYWYRKSENAQKIIEFYNRLNKKKISIEEKQDELKKWIKNNKSELEQVDHYNCIDDRGVYTANTNSSNTKPGGYNYDIFHPITHQPCPKPAYGWRWPEDTFAAYEQNGDVEWGEDHSTQPHVKKRIETAKEQLKTVIYEDGRASTILLENLFGIKKIFDNPKPLHLIKRIIDFVTTSSKSDDSCIVLDFFSGSATTAHAVMQLNAEDGGNRKYICVQLPETTWELDEKGNKKSKKDTASKAAFEAGYMNICEIGKERIRRAGNKIKEENGDKAKDLDIGFRVLKLAESNMKDVFYTPAETTSANLFDANNVKEDRTTLDLLFQILPECALPLSSKIEIQEIDGKTVYFVNGNYLVACFDLDITEDLVKSLVDVENSEKPYIFCMRNLGFKSDKVFDNIQQLFERIKSESNHEVKWKVI